MDRNNSQQARDVVYCHQCENEWYRDEHGITCPECESDFTEIVEPEHDPRQDDQQMLETAGHPDFDVPDPDEDDIDNLRLEQTGPGRYRLHGTYTREVPMRGGQPQLPGQGQGQGGMGAGLMGMVGNIIQGMMGPQQQQLPGQQPQAVNAPGRPASAPGSPAPGQQPGGGGTFVRHGHGPGYSFTIASSSNANFGGGNLLPRNANGPQAFQPQPDNIEQMMAQMFANIGVMPGMGMHRAGAPPFHEDINGPFAGGPFIMGGGGPGGMGPLANILNLFGPPGGVAGDAVYSQEALDRIITQLMEQHQAGNAPGPASETAINSLPTKEISQKDLGDNGKAECSICMDEVQLGGTVTILPCHHWFHHECIKAWLSEHDTCPHCRQGIMPKDDQARSNNQPRSPSQAPLHDMRSPEYARPAPPGAFPFPSRQNTGGSAGSGNGSRQNPFTVPDSPTMNRRNSTGGERRRSSGGGMFSRMRDAFGSGRDGSGPGGSRG